MDRSGTASHGYGAGVGLRAHDHQPPDAELRKYFDENRENYSTEGTMTLHNLLLPKASGPAAMATVQKAADALRAHVPLAEVVKTYGLQELIPEHASEEQFYFAQKIHLGEALYESALFECRDGGAHGLGAHAFGARQLRRGGGPISSQTSEHGDLGQRQLMLCGCRTHVTHQPSDGLREVVDVEIRGLCHGPHHSR